MPPVIEGMQNPLQLYETVNFMVLTVSEHGANEYVDVTYIYKFAEVNTLLFNVYNSPEFTEILRSDPEYDKPLETSNN